MVGGKRNSERYDPSLWFEKIKKHFGKNKSLLGTIKTSRGEYSVQRIQTSDGVQQPTYRRVQWQLASCGSVFRAPPDSNMRFPPAGNPPRGHPGERYRKSKIQYTQFDSRSQRGHGSDGVACVGEGVPELPRRVHFASTAGREPIEKVLQITKNLENEGYYYHRFLICF